MKTESIDSLLEALAECKATIVKQEKEIDRLSSQALKASQDFEDLKTRHRIAMEVSEEFTIKQSKAKSELAEMVAKFLDEFEGSFDLIGICESQEIAEDYITAAKWMMKHYGRTAHRIEEVQSWIDNYTYRPGPSLFDNFRGLFKDN